MTPVEAPVTDPFRPPACEWCPGNRGIEYGPTLGHEVVAAAEGTISFAGPVAGTLYVVVHHPDGTRTTYGMLHRADRARGDFVVAGERLGVAGDRLHFGWRRGDEYLDPTPLMGRLVRRARLVPLDGTAARPGPAATRCVANTSD